MTENQKTAAFLIFAAIVMAIFLFSSVHYKCYGGCATATPFASPIATATK
jgi:hypothetical protein